MKNEKFLSICSVDYYYRDIFLEYEQPELFTVVDAIGGLSLVMLVDAINEKWLLLPISVAKLRKVEYGIISIREAFKTAEINVSIVYNNNGQYFKEEILAQEIKEEYLPLEDARLNWDNIPMPSIQEDLYQTACQRNRDILDIRVISEDTVDHTIEVKSFGSLLIMMNDVVKSIAKAHNRQSGKKRGLTSGCSLNYIGSYAGSFGIRLEAEEYSDLLDETKLTPVLHELFNLLQIVNGLEIDKIVKEKSFEYSAALRKLLKYSCDNNAGLDFSYTTPKARFNGKANLKSEFSKTTLTYLDQLISEEIKEEEFTGDLVSVSTKHHKFTFETDSKEEISGKIDPSLKELQFVVRSYAKIKVKKTIRINKFNETEEQFLLIGYENLTGKF